MKKILLVTLVFVLGGCSTVQEKIKPYADTITDTVCAMTEAEREVLRTEIDQITAPHKIRVECAE